MNEQGVHIETLEKKRQYWINIVKGDDIMENFSDKKIGDTKTTETIFNGHPLYGHCMNNFRYVKNIMSIHGCLNHVATEILSCSVKGMTHYCTQSHFTI